MLRLLGSSQRKGLIVVPSVSSLDCCPSLRQVINGVSRIHATIRRTETGLVLEDLASTNGTWPDGVQVERYTLVPLKLGDHVTLGRLH